MSKIVKRGYTPDDNKEFNEESIQKLYQAGRDLYYLINQGYRIKGASTFVGNHYLLSERQRLALVRAISTEADIILRRKKEIHNSVIDFSKKTLKDSVVHIDGFNTIITLEVALSDSLLLRCLDGTIRDLAGLRGTYRVIDKTQKAIEMIGDTLESYHIAKAVFYLDAPVSNSGRLKESIYDLLEPYSFDLEVIVINNVDSVLEKLDNVISSDAIILDKCIGWFNLNHIIMEKYELKNHMIDFCKMGLKKY